MSLEEIAHGLRVTDKFDWRQTGDLILMLNGLVVAMGKATEAMAQHSAQLRALSEERAVYAFDGIDDRLVTFDPKEKP